MRTILRAVPPPEDEQPVPETEAKPDPREQWFLVLYKMYPRHVDREKARKAFLKLHPTKELCEIIRADIKARLKGEKGRWEMDRKDYIPYMASYLNGKRWEDEE